MLTLFVTYTAKPGKRAAFLEALKQAGIHAAVNAEDGCLKYDYYLDAQDENKVLLVERWESKEKQQIHLTQPHMAAMKDIKAAYIESTALEEV